MVGRDEWVRALPFSPLLAKCAHHCAHHPRDSARFPEGFSDPRRPWATALEVRSGWIAQKNDRIPEFPSGPRSDFRAWSDQCSGGRTRGAPTNCAHRRAAMRSLAVVGLDRNGTQNWGDVMTCLHRMRRPPWSLWLSQVPPTRATMSRPVLCFRHQCGVRPGAATA